LFENHSNSNEKKDYRVFRIFLTTVAPTVRPTEDTGYNRVVPGRTARSSQMEFKIHSGLRFPHKNKPENLSF
jgi:hypothetical protein